MKILKLCAYYEPEQTASSHLTKDLEDGYIKNGFVTEIYVSEPTRGVSAEVRKEYKKKRYEEKNDGHILIHRFRMFREGKNPILRALRYALVNLKQYRYGKRAKEIDIVMAGSTPPTQGMLCAKVAKKLSKKYGKKVPFIYNLQDIFPDSLVNAKMTKKGSFLWKIGRRIEDYSYRNADKIIVISEGFKKNIMEKGVPEEKIVIVPNWVNTDNVYPVERKDNVLFDRYGLDRSKYYICYSGNIGHSQNMRLLLDVAKAMHDEIPDLCFVLVGEGAAKESVAQAVKEEGIDNVVMLPFQDYAEISHVFSLGDVGLIISKPGIGESSVPSKTWSILAASRPVLACFDRDSELCDMVERVGCGVNAAAGDPDALKNAIRTLYNDRAAAARMGQKGREYVMTELNKDKCVGMYVDTVKAVVSSASERSLVH